MDFGTEGYYKKMLELEEKLKNSEYERLKLEEKFQELMQPKSREVEHERLKVMRHKYHKLLEDKKMRQERNENILKTIELIESRAKTLEVKTERFKIFRKHYFENNFKQDAPLPDLKSQCENVRKKLFSDEPPAPSTNNVVETKLAFLEKYLRENFDNFPQDFPKIETQQNYTRPFENINSNENRNDFYKHYLSKKINGRQKESDDESELLGNEIEKRLNLLQHSKQVKELNNNTNKTIDTSDQLIQNYKDLVTRSKERFGLNDPKEDFIKSNEALKPKDNKFEETIKENNLKVELVEDFDEISEETKPPTDVSLTLSSPSQFEDLLNEDNQVEIISSKSASKQNYEENSASDENTRIEMLKTKKPPENEELIQKEIKNNIQQQNYPNQNNYIPNPDQTGQPNEFGEAIISEPKEEPEYSSQYQEQQYQEYYAPDGYQDQQETNQINSELLNQIEYQNIEGQQEMVYDHNPGQQNTVYDQNPGQQDIIYDQNPGQQDIVYDQYPKQQEIVYDQNPEQQEIIYDQNPEQQEIVYDQNPDQYVEGQEEYQGEYNQQEYSEQQSYQKEEEYSGFDQQQQPQENIQEGYEVQQQQQYLEQPQENLPEGYDIQQQQQYLEESQENYPEGYEVQQPQENVPEGYETQQQQQQYLEQSQENYPEGYELQQQFSEQLQENLPEGYETQQQQQYLEESQENYPEGYEVQQQQYSEQSQEILPEGYETQQQQQYVEQSQEGYEIQQENYPEQSPEEYSYSQAQEYTDQQYAENPDYYQTGQEYLQGEQNIDMQYQQEQEQEYQPQIEQANQQNIEENSEIMGDNNKTPLVQKELPNLADLLDTDTSESVKQDTKVSNDSDFDFSNA